MLGGLHLALDGGVGLWAGSRVVGVLRQRPRSGNFGHLWVGEAKKQAGVNFLVPKPGGETTPVC